MLIQAYSLLSFLHVSGLQQLPASKDLIGKGELKGDFFFLILPPDMYTTEIKQKQKQNPRGKNGAGKEAENKSIFIGSPILRAKPPFDHLQNAQGHVGSLQRLNALPSTRAPRGI